MIREKCFYRIRKGRNSIQKFQKKSFFPDEKEMRRSSSGTFRKIVFSSEREDFFRFFFWIHSLNIFQRNSFWKCRERKRIGFIFPSGRLCGPHVWPDIARKEGFSATINICFPVKTDQVFFLFFLFALGLLGVWECCLLSRRRWSFESFVGGNRRNKLRTGFVFWSISTF